METISFRRHSHFERTAWGTTELKIISHGGYTAFVAIVTEDNSICEGSFSTRDLAEQFLAHPFRVIHPRDLFAHEEILLTTLTEESVL